MPTRLYIPPLGSELVLAEPWSFGLYHEYRNELAFVYFDIKLKKHRYGYMEKMLPPVRVMLPAGTKLKVERIYIRKGADDFDSITFTLPEIKRIAPSGSRANRPVRFWVKLPDANTLVFNQETS